MLPETKHSGRPAVGTRKVALQIGMCLALSASVFSCSRSGDNAIFSGTYGMGVSIVGGNNQSQAPSQLYTTVLTVKTFNQTTGAVEPMVPVNFTLMDPVDAVVVIPSGTSDSNGLVTTQIRAPSSYNLSFRVAATVNGTNSAAIFTLATNASGAAAAYVVDTTHADVETAGVPFGFIVKIVDANGDVVPGTNETKPLVWTFTTYNSWTGQTPVLPPLDLDCVFVNGVCQTESIYTLTDSRDVTDPTDYTTKMYVGDPPPSSMKSEFAKVIQVLPNTATQIVLANKQGGPFASGGAAVVYPPGQSIYTTADAAPMTFYPAVVDMAGNYLGDGTSATWSTSSQSPATFFTQNSLTDTSSSATVSPTRTGYGTLTVSQGTLTSTNTSVYISPGAPDHLNLTTSDNQVEEAGKPFTLNINAVDAKNNPLTGNFQTGTGAYTGNFVVTFSVSNGRIAGQVNDTCYNPVLQTATDFTNTQLSVPYPFPSPGPYTMCRGPAGGAINDGGIAAVPFVNGVNNAGFPVTAQLNWAPINNAKIVANAAAAGSFNALSGSTPAIAVSQGPPAAINFYTGANGTGTMVCQRQYVGMNYNNAYPGGDDGGYWFSSTSSGYCPGLLISDVDPPLTLYPSVEDRGGNFLYNTTVNLTPDSNYGTASWVNNDQTSLGSVIFEPQKVGSGNIEMQDTVTRMVAPSVNGQVVSSMTLGVSAGPLDHYQFHVNDGLDPEDTLSVLRTFALNLYAEDIKNNTLSFISDVNIPITVTTTGAQNSPNGTAYVIPPATAQSMDFGDEGYVTYANLQLPNESGASFTATDGTHSTLSAYSPLMITGPLAALGIRTGPAGTGTDITGSPYTITTDQSVTFYPAGYDALGNFLASISTGNWADAGSTPLSAMYSSIGLPLAGTGAVPFAPTVTGTNAALKLTTSGMSAQTGTITVAPGAPQKMAINTQHGNIETAGVPFTTTIVAVDKYGNAETSIAGNLNVTINTLNQPATILNYAAVAPTSGTYPFTAGAMPTQNYTLYNSAQVAAFQYTLASGSDAGLSGTQNVIVNPAGADHLYIGRTIASMPAGGTAGYGLYLLDPWGNIQNTGPYASGQIDVAFTSALTNEGITATTLTGAAPGAGVKTITGTLTNGQGTMNVTATQAGSMTFTGSPLGFSLPNATVADSMTVNPLSTVASVAWDPSYPPPSTYTASASNPMAIFKAELLDTYGNVITTTSSGAFTLTLTTGTGTLGGVLAQNILAGESTFNNITYSKAETITITATENVSGLNKSVSQTITVNAGAATHIVPVLSATTPSFNQTFTPGTGSFATTVTGTVPNVSDCTTFNVTTYVTDDGYNVVNTFSGPISLNVTGDANAVVSPASQTPVAGQATFTVQLRNNGTAHTVVPVSGLANNMASQAFNVSLGAESQTVVQLPGQTYDSGGVAPVSGTPTIMTAGSAQTINAYALDACNNQVSDSSSSISLVATPSLSSPSQINGVGPITLSSGAAAFNTTIYKTGSYTLATNSAYTNVASSALTVQNGTPTQLAFNPNVSSTQTAGQCISLTVDILDNWGNIVTTSPDATSTIGIALLNGGVASSDNAGIASLVASGGVATFNSSSCAVINKYTGTGSSKSGYTFQVSKSGGTSVPTITSASFTVNAATASALAFTTQPGPAPAPTATAGVAFNAQPVIAVQDAYGNATADSGRTIFLTPYDGMACSAPVANTGMLMPSSSPTAVTSSGAASFSGIGTEQANTSVGGPVYFLASATGLTSACSNAVNVAPAAASQIIFVSQSIPAENIVASTVTTGMPVFQVLDTYGNPVGGVTVDFALEDTGEGGGVSPASVTSSTSGTIGLAQPTSVTMPTRTGYPNHTTGGCYDGANAVVASATGTSTGIGATFDLQPAPVASPAVGASLVFKSATSNQSQVVGAPLKSQLSVRLQDQYGNCEYTNGPSGGDQVAVSVYTDSACSDPATGAVLSGNPSAEITTGNGSGGSGGSMAFSSLEFTSPPSPSTAMYWKATDQLGLSVCSTFTITEYTPMTQFCVLPGGGSTTCQPSTAVAGSTTPLLLGANGGVPTDTGQLTSQGSASGTGGAYDPPQLASTTTGCPAGWTCWNYVPGALGGDSTDQIEAYDGSGTSNSGNYMYLNLSVVGAALGLQPGYVSGTQPSVSATTDYPYTIENTDAANTSGTVNYSLTGGGGHFSMNNSCTTLGPSSNCTMQLVFNPSGLLNNSTATATFYFYADPGGATSTITLTGVCYNGSGSGC